MAALEKSVWLCFSYFWNSDLRLCVGGLAIKWKSCESSENKRQFGELCVSHWWFNKEKLLTLVLSFWNHHLCQLRLVVWRSNGIYDLLGNKIKDTTSKFVYCFSKGKNVRLWFSHFWNSDLRHCVGCVEIK